jgi:hypothetical protein
VVERRKVVQPTYRPGARISAEVDLYDVPGPGIAHVTACFAAADGGTAHTVEEGGTSIVLNGHGPGEKTTEEQITTDTGGEPVPKTTVTLLGHVPEKILAGEYKCVSLEVQDTDGDIHKLDDELELAGLAMGIRIVDRIRVVDPKKRLLRRPARFETKPGKVLIQQITAFIRYIQASAKQHMQVIGLLAIALVGVLLLQLAYVGAISGVYGLSGAAKFGDTFGFVTALFTGIGFVGIAATIFTQLQDLKRQEEERNKGLIIQRRITTMKMVFAMENEFESERMRKLRYIACDYFLKADNASSYEPTPIDRTPEEEIAVRDTLNFLERVAHFTNHRDVDDDLVLSVFHSRLRVYFHYTKKYFPPLESSPYSLTLIELRRLCEIGIKDWYGRLYDEQYARWIKDEPQKDPTSIRREIEKLYKAEIEKLYKEDRLRSTLEREHLRGSGQLY